MNWQDGTPRSTDNDFNAVPISTPPEEKRSSKPNKGRPKHYKKENVFDKAMALLAVKKGAFCPHIPTPEEDDRTRSIRNMK